MGKLSKDLSVGSLHPRENLKISGNLGAPNAEIITPCDGCSSFSIDLRGTFNLTLEISGTVDGTNWTLIPARPVNAASIAYVSAITGSVAGIWAGNFNAAFLFIRARVTAHTSGTAIATLVTSTGLLGNSLQGTITPNLLSTTGAAAAAHTLTIPSPGAGLRQYLTYLRIVRSASTALTAGATPTVVTTTNLPGTLAFTFGADAAAQGTDKYIQEDFAYSLAASAQNTAVTVVCPATTGVIWRVTSGWYVAP